MAPNQESDHEKRIADLEAFRLEQETGHRILKWVAGLLGAAALFAINFLEYLRGAD